MDSGADVYNYKAKYGIFHEQHYNTNSVKHFCYVDGNITLDLNTIAAQVAEGETMIFRAYLLCSGDGQYTLTVKSPAIALLYTGDPVDYAISKWGTILTAYITNPTGNSQPFVILNTSKVGL